jgi:REP element-mobilizing transposase RayT
MSNHVGARESRPHRGWHERGYLPHFDAGAVVQTVTFRLADSLPREFFEKAAAVASDARARSIAIEKGIDSGMGRCLLSDPKIAAIVRDVLAHEDAESYRLLSWVVMPNHVHVMMEQIEGHPLELVLQAWKSVSAHKINKQRNSTGRVWSPDYFDRFVRDEAHYANAIYYIEHNPVKARLVKAPEEWPYSSATARTLQCGRGARAPT